MSKPVRISKILSDASEMDTVEERARHLLSYDSPVLQGVLFMMFREDAPKFLLPKGRPPFTPNRFFEEAEGALFAEWRKMYIYLDPTAVSTNSKREQHFIALLESLHPDDAELILALKDRKKPFKGIDLKVARAAYPAMFPTEVAA